MFHPLDSSEHCYDDSVAARGAERQHRLDPCSDSRVDLVLEPSPGAVEPNPDVLGGKAKAVGGLARPETFDLSHHKDRSVRRRKPIDRRLQHPTKLAIRSALNGISVLRWQTHQEVLHLALGEAPAPAN